MKPFQKNNFPLDISLINNYTLKKAKKNIKNCKKTKKYGK